jgi:uncharacterized protein (TIGR03083 family)
LTPHPSSSAHLEAYVEVQRRLVDLVGPNDDETAVIACPAWSVHDVLAHLAGLCDDWVAHQLDGYASDDWTARQVERFTAVDGSQILRHWGDALGAFAELEDDLAFGPPARWAFGDAIIHEADLRGALGAGHVPAQAVDLAMAGSLQRWRDVHERAGLPRIHVRPTDRPVASGSTSTTTGTVLIEAPLYEVFRACAGRRSAAQVASWSWSQDPGPYLAAGPPYPFAWAAHPIDD